MPLSRSTISMVVCLVVALAGAPKAVAQAPLPAEAIPDSARARVTAPALRPAPLVGTLDLDRSDASALVVRLDEGGAAEVPRTAITRLERSLGERTHRGTGAVIGVILGGAAGIWIGGSRCESTGPCPAVAGILGFVFGAGIGLVAGAEIGTAIRAEEWADAPPSILAISRSRPIR